MMLELAVLLRVSPGYLAELSEEELATLIAVVTEQRG